MREAVDALFTAEQPGEQVDEDAADEDDDDEDAGG
jgi:hypothetical protein